MVYNIYLSSMIECEETGRHQKKERMETRRLKKEALGSSGMIVCKQSKKEPIKYLKDNRG